MARGIVKWTAPKRKALCDQINDAIKDESILTVIKLASIVGMTRHALYKLAEDYPDDIGMSLTHAQAQIEHRMIEGSLTRKYDGNFAKFLLSAKYGYTEKTEQSITANVIQEARPVFGDD